MSRADRVAGAWRLLVEALGYDTTTPHLTGTAERVGRFFEGWHTNLSEPPELTTFPSDGVDELIIVRDLAFYSLCAHHGVPFFGTASVGYIPGKCLVGLSKLARVVDHFAHRYTTQEEIGQRVVNHLQETLGVIGEPASRPRAVGCVLRAEHLCMAMRGVLKPGASTVTSSLLGEFRSDAAMRAEFLRLAGT